MTAKLEKPLKRELTIGGNPYVVTLSPEGLKLVVKGRRKGYELDWESLVSGDAALAAALNATLAAAPPPSPAAQTRPAKKKKTRGGSRG